MKPSRSVHLLLIAATLAAAACSTKSPTEPGASVPIGPKVPPPIVTFTITVTASPSHLTIGSTTGSKITVQAANAQDGTPPPNLTPVTLTTTLGEFNSVGSAVQSVNLQLVGGRAQAVLFPGTSAGTATVGATSPAANGAVFTPGATSVVIGSPGTFFVNSLSPNTGDPAGGLVVTISGGGFQAPVAVSFGGSSASVKSVSPNAIQVITPPSSVPVPVGTTLQVGVTVTNNIGGTLAASATLNNAFTYVPGGGGIQQPLVFSVNPASGTNDGGTLVTIVGQGFVAPVQVFFGSGANAATFNGIEATVQSVTATQIIVVTPPARGLGQDNTNQLVSILVKNTGSGFATVDTAAFKFGSKVVVTSVAPNQTRFDQQVKVTIFGQGFADPVAVSLAGIAAQVLSVSGTEIQVLALLPHVTSCANIFGPVQVTNLNNGDSNTGPTFTYLVPKPVIGNISPSQGGELGGILVTVNGLSFDPGFMQVLFGTSAATIDSSSITVMTVTNPPFNGSFGSTPCVLPGGVAGMRLVPTSVDVVVNDALTGCSSTLTGGFTYNPLNNACEPTIFGPPAASFTSTVETGGFTVIFHDTSTNFPTSWTWNFGDGSPATAQNTMENPVHTYAAVPMTYTVTLTACNQNGCNTASNFVTVPGT
jgi:PKD domain/IPT/TIG domain